MQEQMSQVASTGLLAMQLLIHIGQESRIINILRGRMSLYAYLPKRKPLSQFFITA